MSTLSDEEYITGLHAIEHALISLLPREVLCDRADVGGLSTTSHPQTAGATIFVHDVHPGGTGYAAAAYDDLEALLEETLALLEECDCASGCPSCIHSPQCGNANRDLSKELAIDILQSLVG